MPDGFGGKNSAFTRSCAGGDSGRDPIAGLPEENRPAGFPFDTDAGSALVTASHVDAYLAAAEQLADDAAARIAELHPCDWAGDREGCGGELVEQLGRRIFRRSLTGDELAQ